MTSLLVNSSQAPIPIDLSSLMTVQMTDQQFYDFCQANPELRIERNATGDVIVMPPSFADIGHRNGNIFGQLYIWAETNGTGEAFDSSSGFTLPNGAMRSPDASWIVGDRWQALTLEQQASFAPIVPDFVVELRSSSDALVQLEGKMEEYIANGVRLGLLVDRQKRQVQVYRPEQRRIVLDQPDAVDCSPELPLFKLKMAKIW